MTKRRSKTKTPLFGTNREIARSGGMVAWSMLGTILHVGTDVTLHGPMKAAKETLEMKPGKKR